MKINQKKQPQEKGHLNHMGGVSYSINNPIQKLKIVCSSCFFGEPMYYHNDNSTESTKNKDYDDSTYKYLENVLGDVINIPNYHNLKPSTLIEKVIDEALDYDSKATILEAIRLRKKDHIRVTPQVIMVRAANHDKVRGTNLISTYNLDVMSRTDDAITQFAYQKEVFGKPIPNSLKKSWKKFLELKSEYDLAKYKLNNKKYKLVDLVNICHAFSPSIDKLMKGNLNNNENTWESFISKNGSKTETWSAAVDLMGHMALLRNIRNFIEHDVNESLYIDKLLNGVKQGQQLPFRYYSAYNAVSNSNKKASGKILDTIEQCLEISLENLPVFNGNVISLCDNSGSAQNTTTSDMGTVKISDIANLTGVITGKKSENGYVGVFGDNLKIMPIRKTSSTFDQVKQMNKLAENIGQGTEHGIWLFFEKALEEKQHWDHIFIYSDQQAGTGGLYGNPSKYRDYMWKKQRNIDVAALIKEYRQKVNKNVNVYLVQVAGYQDAIAPSYFNKTYLLGGWGEGLLKFAHSVSQK